LQTQDAIPVQIEYRVVLALPKTQEVLARSDGSAYCLPRVHIPQWARPAAELQQAIKAAWNLFAIILEFLPSP